MFAHRQKRKNNRILIFDCLRVQGSVQNNPPDLPLKDELEDNFTKNGQKIKSSEYFCFLFDIYLTLPSKIWWNFGGYLVDIGHMACHILHEAKKESTRDSFSTQVFINHAEDGS